MIPEFTTVVAVDAEHLAELAAVFPTWYHFRPELLQHPLWVVRDTDIAAEDILRATRGCVDRILDLPPEMPTFPTQREKMLTAIVRATASVPTPYYLKLDTDAVAVGPGRWIDPAWFVGEPVLVASPWGYTKPAEFLTQLDQWAQTQPALAACPRPPRRVTGRVARSRRIISWCLFGDTAFARHVSEELCGGIAGRLPVPSQDTLLWYVAESQGRPCRRVRMSRYGWRHLSDLRRLQEAARWGLAKHGLPADGGLREWDDA